MEEEDFVATTNHLDDDEFSNQVFSEDSEENEAEDDTLDIDTTEAKSS